MEAIAVTRARAERGVTNHQRAAESMTALGRARTLYFFVALMVGWTALNSVLPAAFGVRAPDQPPFL